MEKMQNLCFLMFPTPDKY